MSHDHEELPPLPIGPIIGALLLVLSRATWWAWEFHQQQRDDRRWSEPTKSRS